MNHEVLLTYLKEHKPYLHDIETGIQKIINATGYGEVSATIRVINGMVDKGSLFTSEEKMYKRRAGNRLV